MAHLKIGLADSFEKTDPSVSIPQVMSYEFGVKAVCQAVELM